MNPLNDCYIILRGMDDVRFMIYKFIKKKKRKINIII